MTGKSSLNTENTNAVSANAEKYELSSPIKVVKTTVINSIRENILKHSLDGLLEKPKDIKKFAEEYLPDFLELSHVIRYRLEHEFRFVVVRDLPFLAYGQDIAGFLLIALLSNLGEATHTGLPQQKKKSVVWKVQPTKSSNLYHRPTISQHSEAADLHTDSSYKNDPERYMSLLNVNPAKDNGGRSILVDGREVIERMLHLHKDISDLESLEFTFAVPEVFRSEADEEIRKFPIFSSDPFLIRYRYDLIEMGESIAGRNQRLNILFKDFKNSLEKSKKYYICLNKGDLLVVNNHEILHGRTAFDDPQRLLLRVRLSSS